MTPYVAQVSPAARRAVFRDLIRKNKHLPGYAVCSFVSIAKLSAGGGVFSVSSPWPPWPLSLITRRALSGIQ